MRGKRSGKLWALIALLAVLFLWGAAEVVTIPLQTGEVYPEFSSLRADPRGAKALYESLQALPELTVSQLFKERPVLEAGETRFLLGVNPGGWVEVKQSTVTAYEKQLAKGGRLVIGFLPVLAPREVTTTSPVLQDRWKLKMLYRSRGERPVAVNENSQMPRRSALYFETGPEWKVLERQEGQPVAIERPLGGGTLVLVADTFPISNEWLMESRDATMIAELVGEKRTVDFDEVHFGVGDQGGVAVLLRKYGLEGGIGVLLLASALFMWRSASSFLPPTERAKDEAVVGRDAQAGLTSLLRRSVPESDLLDACFGEWSRTAPAERKAFAVEAAITGAKGRGVAEGYRAACAALKETK